MKISDDWLRRRTAGCLVIFLTVPLVQAASAQPQQQAPAQPVASAPSSTQAAQTSGQNSVNPQSAPATNTPQPEGTASSRNPTDPQAVGQDQKSDTSQPPPEPQQQNPNKPVGTAAAPYEKTTGVAASRPAGAVIAPAKQKRAHSILIKVGIIVGAAIAIGVVAGLSKASPSRPN